MNILITGANGFIGSHLVAKLAQDINNTVYAVYRKDNQANLPQVKKIFVDLSTENFENQLPKEIDCIVHLAQSEAYREFPEKANQIFDINVKSTQRIAEWALKNKIKKFIFSSTGNVYKQQNILLKENDTCEPIGYYGASKFAAEQLIKPYQDFFDVFILRIFGVYGPGQKQMTIPNIIDRVKNNSTVTLAKNAGLFFTPLYIDDCIEMIERIINSTNPKKFNTYNLAGSETIHLGELTESIGEILGINPKIEINNNEPMYLMGDVSLFNKDFGYNTNTNIKKGLTQTLKHE